jgi:uncharacterized protein GlcG (DUF336 family)
MRAITKAAVAVSIAMMMAPALQAQAQNGSDALPKNVAAKMPFDAPYGQPISLASARKVVDAALAEAAKRHWNEACAVVEGNGQLVLFEKQDNTQYGSTLAAVDKAKSAALYRRPTAVWAGAVAHGASFLMQLAGVNAVPGGLPIVEGGRLIGGLGCSGGTGEQDIFLAKTGLKALAGQ